ncbi:MAG: hypothetical protein E7K72_24115, partial [Roseomonas mucosa]|nr:hypothetical protein [Roseomonas mucosa]
ACRTCGGRLMRNRDNVFWCPGCGVESKVTDGAAPISICGCGINMGPAGTFRCVVNPERSASSPYIIVVASNADAIKAPDPKP